MDNFDANEVEPGLWLGSEDAAHAPLHILKQHNITHVLVVGFGLTELYPQEFIYCSVRAIDVPFYNIVKDVPKCIRFIEMGLSDGKGVLVHCARGVSRSASIVIAYLMVHRHISYEEAYSIVRSARNVACPNFSFQTQLKEFEATLQEGNGSSSSIQV